MLKYNSAPPQDNSTPAFAERNDTRARVDTGHSKRNQ